MQLEQSDSPKALNSTYVECHHQIKAFKAQEENRRLRARLSIKTPARFSSQQLPTMVYSSGGKEFRKTVSGNLWNTSTRRWTQPSTLRKYKASLLQPLPMFLQPPPSKQARGYAKPKGSLSECHKPSAPSVKREGIGPRTANK
jgi:hypothetical protein